MFAVIRVRGSVNVRRDIKDTMKMMRLTRTIQCVLLPENPTNKGMLMLSKDFITWGEIENPVLENLVLKRGRLPNEKRVEEKDLKNLVQNVLKEGTKKSGLNPVFKLHPPSKGYRNTKQPFPKGDLGYRAQKINEILERMI